MGNRAKRFRTFSSFSTHNSAEPGEGSVLRQTRSIDCGTRKSLTCRLRKRLRARHWARGSARPERALWGFKDGGEAGLQPEDKRLAAPIKAVFIWGFMAGQCILNPMCSGCAMGSKIGLQNLVFARILKLL